MIRAIAPITVVACAMLAVGCEQYRVEYRTVPSFYRDAMAGDKLDEQATLADGTTIVYQTRSFGGTPERGEGSKDEKTFKSIIQNEDGSVELHAILPEQVLGNLIFCLREERYADCWKQVLSETTRQAMAAAGEGEEEFTSFLQRNRRDLLVTLQRMAAGLPRQQVMMEPGQNGIIRMKFRPHVAVDFNYRRVDLITEGYELKLLVIK